MMPAPSASAAVHSWSFVVVCRCRHCCLRAPGAAAHPAPDRHRRGLSAEHESTRIAFIWGALLSTAAYFQQSTAYGMNHVWLPAAATSRFIAPPGQAGARQRPSGAARGPLRHSPPRRGVSGIWTVARRRIGTRADPRIENCARLPRAASPGRSSPPSPSPASCPSPATTA